MSDHCLPSEISPSIFLPFDLLLTMATLHQTRLQLQDLSCELNYATKQDKYLSSDLQKRIDAALQAIEKIHGISPAFSQLEAGAIRERLIQSMATEVERADQITDVLDLLDELDMLMTQISMMQAAEPDFAYKETIQPYNQV